MRILVGIMYCIEQEYELCMQAIRDQTHTDWEMFSIENLPNKEAHDRLYNTFMSRASEFDLFIKVDADMVLCRNTFFEEVIEEVKTKPGIRLFQVGVWDHFTNRMILGLNIFKNTVTWEKNNERYFVDRVYSQTNSNKYTKKNKPLAPAADHCPSPSPFQAFHFGVHKVAKVLQKGEQTKARQRAKGHAKNIILLLKNQKNSSKEFLVYAVLGVKWALEEKIGYKEVDFSSKKTNNAFLKCQNLTSNEKQEQIKELHNLVRIGLSDKIIRDYFINRFTFEQSHLKALFSSVFYYFGSRYPKK